MVVNSYVEDVKDVLTTDGSGNVALRAVLEGTTGDLTVNGDLTVTQTVTTQGNEVTEGSFTIDITDGEAFLVRQDGDSGDVFTVDTSNTRVGIGTSSPSHPFDVDDSNGNSLMDVRSGDTTVFYNGIDAGPIQAAEDTYQQLIDQNVTSALAAGIISSMLTTLRQVQGKCMWTKMNLVQSSVMETHIQFQVMNR